MAKTIEAVVATTTEIEEWLDKQIKARKMMNEELVIHKHEPVDDTLKNFSATESIHIGAEAVRFLAEYFRLPLCVKARKLDADNPYEVFVIYQHEVFFGLETEEEYRERGAVV